MDWHLVGIGVALVLNSIALFFVICGQAAIDARVRKMGDTISEAGRHGLALANAVEELAKVIVEDGDFEPPDGGEPNDLPKPPLRAVN